LNIISFCETLEHYYHLQLIKLETCLQKIIKKVQG